MSVFSDDEKLGREKIGIAESGEIGEVVKLRDNGQGVVKYKDKRADYAQGAVGL